MLRFALALAISGCTVDVELPPGTVLRCGADEACPSGTRCAGGLCVGPDASS